MFTEQSELSDKSSNGKSEAYSPAVAFSVDFNYPQAMLEAKQKLLAGSTGAAFTYRHTETPALEANWLKHTRFPKSPFVSSAPEAKGWPPAACRQPLTAPGRGAEGGCRDVRRARGLTEAPKTKNVCEPQEAFFL